MQQNNQSCRRKWLIVGLAGVLSVTLLAGCGKKATNAAASSSPSASAPAKPDPATVVATYKGGTITQGEMDKFIGATLISNPMLEQYVSSDPNYQAYFMQSVLPRLAVDKALFAQATDEQKKNADTQTNEVMKQFDDQLKQQKDQMEPKMKAMGLTRDDVMNSVKQTTAAQLIMEAKVTDQLMKDEYDKTIKDYKYYFDVVTVSHILVALKDAQTDKDLRTKEEALKRAQDVQKKLTDGGDMAALAKEYSDDGGSKDTGGKYENQELGVTNWVPEFKQAAETLPVGKVSDPVETQYGYHVMRVDSRKTKTSDEAKLELKDLVLNGLFSDFFKSLDFKDTRPKPSPDAAASPAASASPGESASPSPEATKK